MKDYEEDEYLMLSGIQHFAFCRRQWALIHIEQQWAENYRTIDGSIFHEHTHDEDFKEIRNGIIITRGLKVFSKTLGINGNCDVVEFHPSDCGVQIYGKEGKFIPLPIEYKRGRPKEDHADELQLCAQGMCLEEMLLCNIPYGYLFYGETKRRVKIEFTSELKKTVECFTKEMHQLYEKGYTPKVKTSKKCKSCSIEDMCIPTLNKTLSVETYFKSYLEGGDKE